MNWRGHIGVGAVFCAGVSYGLGAGWVQLLFAAVFGALCALVPDLDHDMSKGRKWLDLLAIAFALMTAYSFVCRGSVCLPAVSAVEAAAVLFLAILGAYFLIFRLFKPRHRGITHTLVACFGFGVLMYLVAGGTIALVGAAGYFSHLLADRHIRLI